MSAIDAMCGIASIRGISFSGPIQTTSPIGSRKVGVLVCAEPETHEPSSHQKQLRKFAPILA